jgi:hypothetical protein
MAQVMDVVAATDQARDRRWDRVLGQLSGCGSPLPRRQSP